MSEKKFSSGASRIYYYESENRVRRGEINRSVTSSRSPAAQIDEGCSDLLEPADCHCTPGKDKQTFCNQRCIIESKQTTCERIETARCLRVEAADQEADRPLPHNC